MNTPSRRNSVQNRGFTGGVPVGLIDGDGDLLCNGTIAAAYPAAGIRIQTDRS